MTNACGVGKTEKGAGLVPLADVMLRMAGPDARIEFTAFDGSRAGRPDAPVRLDLRSPIALSHLASAPGELGLARAYITGSLEVIGDLYTLLDGLPDLTTMDIPAGLRFATVARLAAARVWWPVGRPAQETRLHGRRHSKSRDAKAISHHYDVSNR